MTRLQRVEGILKGLIMIGFAIVLMTNLREGCKLIMDVLPVVLMVPAVSMLFFWFTMARFMVGGRVALFRGVILLDLAVFTTTLDNVRDFYIILYLVLIHAFAGLIEMLRASEAYSGGASSWRLKAAHGIMDIAIAIACIFFIHRIHIAIMIFGFGLIYSGILSIISACRRTKLVFIQ